MSALTQGLTGFASNATIASSMQKLAQRSSQITNPVAIVSADIQMRSIKRQAGAFDYERIDIPLGMSSTFNKAEYLGFEKIIVNSIHIMPFTDIVIVHQNRFNKKTVIHNGTGADRIVRWDDFNPFTLKPYAFSITAMPTHQDGVYKVYDGSKWCDIRWWAAILITSLVVIIVITLIVSAISHKEGYKPLMVTRPTYMPEDLHAFSEIRKNTRMPKPYDWEKHSWV